MNFSEVPISVDQNSRKRRSISVLRYVDDFSFIDKLIAPVQEKLKYDVDPHGWFTPSVTLISRRIAKEVEETAGYSSAFYSKSVEQKIKDWPTEMIVQLGKISIEGAPYSIVSKDSTIAINIIGDGETDLKSERELLAQSLGNGHDYLKASPFLKVYASRELDHSKLVAYELNHQDIQNLDLRLGPPVILPYRL